MSEKSSFSNVPCFIIVNFISSLSFNSSLYVPAPFLSTFLLITLACTLYKSSIFPTGFEFAFSPTTYKTYIKSAIPIIAKKIPLIIFKVMSIPFVTLSIFLFFWNSSGYFPNLFFCSSSLCALHCSNSSQSFLLSILLPFLLYIKNQLFI